jgi:hypothetical protein
MSKSEAVGVTFRLAVCSQSARLGAKSLEIHDQYFFQRNSRGYSLYVTSSLTRGWVCRLQLLLALASVVVAACCLAMGRVLLTCLPAVA